LIPLDSVPSSAFCLCTWDNFECAWPEYLLAGLRARGFDVTALHVGGQLKASYDGLMESLWNRYSLNHDNFGVASLHPLMRLLLQRTIAFRQLREILSPDGDLLSIKNRKAFDKPCSRCEQLEEHRRCVQEIVVTPRRVEKDLLGCGVSFHPEEYRQYEGRRGVETPSKGVKHPVEDLKLKIIEPTAEVIQRCGIQVYRIVDNKRNLLDVWVYNAFPKYLLNRMLEHHANLPKGLKGLTRGQQFLHYSQGKMVAQGERTPSGGAPGDVHRFPDNMNATDLDSLNSLYDQAEDALIISQVTRLVAFPIFENVRETGAIGERLGALAHTLYYCTNYVAPAHEDQDEGKGLCANLLKEGEKTDYAFFHLAYGLLFIAESNSLWSFSGTDAHGTVLPSLKRVMQVPGDEDGKVGGPGPEKVNKTNHITKSRKNAASARRYLAVQRSRDEIGRRWNVSEGT
ncbi:hypothetical protein DFP72DRAFT_834356, partial [Ephemerocybe angulata]